MSANQNSMPNYAGGWGTWQNSWLQQPGSATNSSSRAATMKNAGTGYAGNQQDGPVRSKLQSQAGERERQRERQYQQLFQQFSNSSKRQQRQEPPSKIMLERLKEVLRNTAQWSQRHVILTCAVECVNIIQSQHPQLLGSKDDSESLWAAWKECSQTALVFQQQQQGQSSSQNNNTSDARLAQTILALHPKVVLRTRQPELAMLDSSAHYRQSLQPLSFEFVSDLRGHAWRNNHNQKFTRHQQQHPTNRQQVHQQKSLLREITTYKTSLPVEYGSSIFVRAMEGRMDILRALIIGPSPESPYANGCFLFDIFLGDGYPSKPPQVRYLTTGAGKYRFNPNLYESGKVCLSLLGTWSGPGWTPGESTLLQVLVSIQSLIFVPDPYFNEPAYECSRGTRGGNLASQEYNKKIRRYTIECAILPFLLNQNRYPEFHKVIEQHFYLKKDNLQKQLFQWYQEDCSSTSMHRLYNQCLEVWEQQCNQKQIRKKRPIQQDNQDDAKKKAYRTVTKPDCQNKGQDKNNNLTTTNVAKKQQRQACVDIHDEILEQPNKQTPQYQEDVLVADYFVDEENGDTCYPSAAPVAGWTNDDAIEIMDDDDDCKKQPPTTDQIIDLT